MPLTLLRLRVDSSEREGRADDPAEGARRQRSFLVLTLAAFVAVVASFTASIAYTDSQAGEIDEAAKGIAEDDAPSIQHLAAARAELRRFQAIVADYVNDAVLGRPRDGAEIERSLAVLDGEVASFLVLPVYPAEQREWSVVARTLDAIDRDTHRMMSLVAAGDAKGANALADGALRAEIDQASDAFLATIDVDAAHVHAQAVRIHDRREHVHRLALGLWVLSAALAVIAAAATATLAQRYTALLAAQRRLVQRRADELEQFAGRVAHDVLGPLHAVGLALELTARRLPGDQAGQATIERGRRSVERARGIVDGLLAFARAGARPEPGARADVCAVIEDVVGEIAQSSPVELRVEAIAPCPVAASRGVVTSVISNLVQNAIKYMGDARVRRVTVRAQRACGSVRVEVEDTGPGIAPELAEVVFEPHVRGPSSGQPGIGLGLATVRRLVEAHGGRVGVRSVVGQGSLFWFELPGAPVDAAARAS